MSKATLSDFVNDTRRLISKRSPEILTGIGVAGMITTTVLAVKATPKALALIEDEKKRQNYELVKEAKDNGDEDCNQITVLKPVEVIKVAWKPYIPPVVTGVMSIICLIGATSVNAKRTAALATAYKLSETALSEYREKVIETIGEKKEKHVRDKVAEERVRQNPVSKNEVIVTNNGKTLCFDPISGRYFYSTIDTIKRAELKIKENILKDFSGYASLNDFYDELGLDHTSIGDDLGWNIDKLIEINFSSQLNDNDEPSVVLDYLVAPHYDYYKSF